MRRWIFRLLIFLTAIFLSFEATPADAAQCWYVGANNGRGGDVTIPVPKGVNPLCSITLAFTAWCDGSSGGGFGGVDPKGVLNLTDLAPANAWRSSGWQIKSWEPNQGVLIVGASFSAINSKPALGYFFIGQANDPDPVALWGPDVLSGTIMYPQTGQPTGRYFPAAASAGPNDYLDIHGAFLDCKSTDVPKAPSVSSAVFYVVLYYIPLGK